ncbi:FixH family protein [Herbaspirillum sp. RV1423]|uniref:FixH family protein n=1 Tax=Herbaspirillum sp. RV1423 TaxID=1443993 RepID=UPI0005587282|nr:FixH family protein [Herbaspirillum sp. RV1423]
MQATPTIRPWYTHRWPWLLMLGPALVIVAGTFTAWLAVTREDALVVGDYYKEGNAINQDLRRDRVATRLGVSMRLGYDPVAGKLQGNVRSKGVPLEGKLQLHLAHPTRPEKDIRLAIDTDSRGDFSVALPMLELSRWQVLLENDKRDWRVAGVWHWPQQRTIDLAADQP